MDCPVLSSRLGSSRAQQPERLVKRGEAIPDVGTEMGSMADCKRLPQNGGGDSRAAGAGQ